MHGVFSTLPQYNDSNWYYRAPCSALCESVADNIGQLVDCAGWGAICVYIYSSTCNSFVSISSRCYKLHVVILTFKGRGMLYFCIYIIICTCITELSTRKLQVLYTALTMQLHSSRRPCVHHITVHSYTIIRCIAPD